MEWLLWGAVALFFLVSPWRMNFIGLAAFAVLLIVFFAALAAPFLFALSK